MKHQNRWLIGAVILLSVLPLWWVPRPAMEPGGQAAEIFTGSDDKAQQAITEIAPNYQPWFSPILEPASEEIASLLFALQAALGAGVIGYWLGAAREREKMREQARREASTAGLAERKPPSEESPRRAD